MVMDFGARKTIALTINHIILFARLNEEPKRSFGPNKIDKAGKQAHDAG